MQNGPGNADFGGKAPMALTDLQVKQASPKVRDWKISDGGE
jgi:hypothetical protein